MIPFLYWTTEKIDNVDLKTTDMVETHMWTNISVALHIFLPVAGLMIFWGRRDLFLKLLMQIDRSYVSVFCPSFSRRERILKWASSRLPSTWSSQVSTLASGIEEFWKDGSLLCTIINSAIPGACPNPHRHWKKSFAHGQALAFKYLGIAPAFTEKDFAEHPLSTQQEGNLIGYLMKIQQAIVRLSDKDDKHQKKRYSTRYVARGMGLFTGEQNRKTVFYIYANVNCNKSSDILISLKGPFNSFGRVTVAFQKSKGLDRLPANVKSKATAECGKGGAQRSFLKLMRVDLRKIVKKQQDEETFSAIPIETEHEKDRLKVTFIPKHSGIYELCVVSEGELLKGAPFCIHVMKNVSGVRDSFKAGDGKGLKNYTKRKILSRVIDFIDEKLVIKNIFRYGGPESKLLLENIEEDACASDEETPDFNQNVATFKTMEIGETGEKGAVEKRKERAPANEFVNHKNLFSECLSEISKREAVSDEDNSSCDYEVKGKIKIFQDQILKNSESDLSKSECYYSTSDENDDAKKDDSIATPICPNHIVSEVEIKPKLTKTLPHYNKQAFSPKPRLLKKQNSLSTSEETSSILSGNESDAGSEYSVLEQDAQMFKINNRHAKLSVLNVLNSLKQKNDNYIKIINKNTNYNNVKDCTFEYKLKLAAENNLNASLPDLSSEYQLRKCSSAIDLDKMYLMNFKERKDYWNRICSRSNLAVDKSAGKHFNNLQRFASKETALNLNLDDEKFIKNKIFSSNESVFRTNSLNRSREKIDFSYSLKENLDEKLFPSVEQRKAILLEKLTLEQKVLEEKSQTNKQKPAAPPDKTKKPKIENALKTPRVPVTETIKLFDPPLPSKNVSKSNGRAAAPREILSPREGRKKAPKSAEPQDSRKRFKKLQRFFEQLEKGKGGEATATARCRRRCSLDSKTGKKQKRHKRETGSLNLPNLSERFSISNLYEDIFGDRRAPGSLRGSPNRKALADVFASFNIPTSDSVTAEEINDIKFNIFIKKRRYRNRESVRSLFEINY